MQNNKYGEPWQCGPEDENSILREKGEYVVKHKNFEDFAVMTADDRRRVVACVNACSQFSTEELESLDKNNLALRVW